MTRTGRLVIVTPHPSGALPADVLHDMLGAEMFDSGAREALLRRVFLDGDPFTDLIFHRPGARLVQAPWSRFTVDLNRDRDDREDNGVVKLTTFDRQALYPEGFTLTGEAREARLRRTWDPFHALLDAEAREAALVIVGHAMAPTGPALGPDQGAPRPALCLMTGTAAAPTVPEALWAPLQQAAVQAFAPVLGGSAIQGVTVGVPWTTDTISRRLSRAGTPAFGLEVNSGLYLDGGQPRGGVLRDLNAAFIRFADAALALIR